MCVKTITCVILAREKRTSLIVLHLEDMLFQMYQTKVVFFYVYTFHDPVPLPVPK